MSQIQTANKNESNLIIRKVKMNRSRSPFEAIDATGRVKYVNRSVAKSMPRGEGEEMEVVFFKLIMSEDDKFLGPYGRWISGDNLMKEYDRQDLDPADPYTLAAINEADPAFADKIPNGTQWKTSKGWCMMSFDFSPKHNQRKILVTKLASWEKDIFWFAGIRKKVSK